MSESKAQSTVKDALLLRACKRNHFAKIKQLLEEGANPNVYNDKCFPLLLAASRNCPELVALLLQSGARVDGPPGYFNDGGEKDNMKPRPLFMAVQRQLKSMVQVLLAAGADPLIPCRMSEEIPAMPPVHLACRLACLPIMKVLYAHKKVRAALEEPEREDDEEAEHNYHPNAGLMLCVVHDQVECAKFLLQAGVPVNSPSAVFAFGIALQERSLRCARALFLAGVPVDGHMGTCQSTALHIAAHFGLDGWVDLLCRLGVDVDAVDGDGDTALALAVNNRSVGTVQTLLRWNAKIGQQNVFAGMVEAPSTDESEAATTPTPSPSATNSPETKQQVASPAGEETKSSQEAQASPSSQPNTPSQSPSSANKSPSMNVATVPMPMTKFAQARGYEEIARLLNGGSPVRLDGSGPPRKSSVAAALQSNALLKQAHCSRDSSTLYALVLRLSQGLSGRALDEYLNV